MKTTIPGKDYIEVAPQNITEEDKAVLHAVVDKEQYAAGDKSRAFAINLANYFGVSKAFLVNSGSSALLVALTAAKEFSGDRKYVITSALGFPTTAAAIYQAGFIPWFLDCDPKTLHVPMNQILDCVERTIGINPGETTADKKFSLETVNCLGCCALGPVVEIDGQYHGKLNTANVAQLLSKYS